MPKIYSKNCAKCGKHYKGIGKKYCSRQCYLTSSSIGRYERTAEHKKVMSERLKGRDVYWIRGKKRPEHSKFLKEWWTPERRQLKSQQMKNFIISNPHYIQKYSNYGEKNPMWRGGIARRGYKEFYQLLKDRIKKRDNFQCQLCGMSEEESIKQFKHRLGVHHIDYDKTNSNEINLITLCNRCNSKINYEREKWKEYFQKIANICGNG